ncbi:MAG: DUF2098 family protein [Methanosarcinaceae archaeon]|nr:DUF2098 family protein [Methanosarcinaceae archaeon]MDD4497549.1 DUF2098 family protein [Methanosarcinaceae archaeon]
MADAEVITAVSRNKKPIKTGDVVKYLNSDTISRVAAIEKKEDGIWVLLEKTNLWYRGEILELTDAEIKEKKEKKELKAEDIKEKLEREKDIDLSVFGSMSSGGAG